MVFPGKSDNDVYYLLRGLSGCTLFGRLIFIAYIAIYPSPEGGIADYGYNAFDPTSAGKAIFDELALLGRGCGYSFRAFGSEDFILHFQVLHLPDQVTMDYPAQKQQKLLEYTAVYGIRLSVVHRFYAPSMAKTVVINRCIFYNKLGDFSFLKSRSHIYCTPLKAKQAISG